MKNYVIGMLMIFFVISQSGCNYTGKSAVNPDNLQIENYKFLKCVKTDEYYQYSKESKIKINNEFHRIIFHAEYKNNKIHKIVAYKPEGVMEYSLDDLMDDSLLFKSFNVKPENCLKISEKYLYDIDKYLFEKINNKEFIRNENGFCYIYTDLK